MSYRIPLKSIAYGLALALACGCGKGSGTQPARSGSGSEKDSVSKAVTPTAGTTSMVAVGSDTMVNVAQAWAEEYNKKHPNVHVQVRGGGSGVGISALINGTCDMANASRTMKQKEKDKITAKGEAEPVEHTVGYDALGVYVHKDNPIDTISIPELAEIYGDGGTIDQWSQVSEKAAGLGEITRVSRQNSSGTYAYFRTAILGKGDYKQGSYDQSGSKDVVALVGTTPSAIGYSGMGYATAAVKMLNIATEKGGTAVAPTVENATDQSYPITRPLHIYTIGHPTGALKEYIDWIKSSEGQQVVINLGYVPIKQ